MDRGWQAYENFAAYTAVIAAANDKTAKSTTMNSWELDRHLDELYADDPATKVIACPDDGLLERARAIFHTGNDPISASGHHIAACTAGCTYSIPSVTSTPAGKRPATPVSALDMLILVAATSQTCRKPSGVAGRSHPIRFAVNADSPCIAGVGVRSELCSTAEPCLATIATRTHPVSVQRSPKRMPNGRRAR